MREPTLAPRAWQRREVLRSMAGAAGGLALSGWLTACSDAEPTSELFPVDPDRPWWLQNNFAPVFEEVEALDLPVEGAIPPELTGVFVRNGPNPATGDSPHWFLGDGMLHGIRLEGGRARWYRNRYVRTPPYLAGLSFQDAGPPIGGNNQSNVSTVYHAGKLLSSAEVGAPYEIDPSTLDTLGVNDFAGKLNTAFTAHPKIDPDTGYLHFFGYFFAPPYLTYHVADETGVIIHSTEIPIPRATMIHSFAITERDVVFWDLPVIFDGTAAAEGIPFRWSDDHIARIGVLPLGGTGDQIRWVEIEPCWVFHELNAFRDGDDVVLDVCRSDRALDGRPLGTSNNSVRRWRVGTSEPALSFQEEILFDRALEFPSLDRRRIGRMNQHGWFGTFRRRPDTVDPAGILHLDRTSGDVREWVPAPSQHAGEAFFTPGGSGEGEGWLLTYLYDHVRDTSSFAVFDAQNVDHGPIAEVPLPQRVPFGLHGVWVPDGA